MLRYAKEASQSTEEALLSYFYLGQSKLKSQDLHSVISDMLNGHSTVRQQML